VIRNVTGSNECVPVRHGGCAAATVEELPVPSFSQPQLTLLTESSAEVFTTPALAATSSDESWRLDALCAETDPEAFFPEKGGSTREAKRVCTGCTVRAECLEFALRNDERFGIWGGLSERERRRLRLQRRLPLSA
jgi:WhiB family redox-sensing transcriptional regulator